MRFSVSVEVMPKSEVADPQGATIERALPTLGIDGIHDVRVGKRIAFVVEAADERSATKLVEDSCRRFLSNPVIENFTFAVTSAPAPERVGG